MSGFVESSVVTVQQIGQYTLGSRLIGQSLCEGEWGGWGGGGGGVVGIWKREMNRTGHTLCLFLVKEW